MIKYGTSIPISVDDLVWLDLNGDLVCLDDEEEALPPGSCPLTEDKEEGPSPQELEEERQKKLRKKKLEDGLCPTCGRNLRMTHHGLVCPEHGVNY